MNKAAFFRGLALSNIRNNRRFYIPYILTGAGTSMMLYILLFITTNKGLTSMFGGGQLMAFLAFGCIIVGIFSIIIILYTNSFLMKRRRRELGLFHILGMEKRHLARIQLWETLFVGGAAIILGLLLGVLFSKLAILVLSKLVGYPTPFGFSVSAMAAGVTAAFFACVYVVTLLYNIFQVGRTNAVDMLKSESLGQREPKAKWLLAVIGALALGGGYYISITTESPLAAIPLFFLAVLLVILGTYCLFTAGSIAVLKLLRKNKNYYYKTKHFIGVSGMIYRMKQNAVGLSNICILSTMVLVMLSTTIALNIGIEDLLYSTYPSDMALIYNDPSDGVVEAAAEASAKFAEKEGTALGSIKYSEQIDFVANAEGETFRAEPTDTLYSEGGASVIVVIPAEEYQRLSGVDPQLEADAALAWVNRGRLESRYQYGDFVFEIAGQLDAFPVGCDLGLGVERIYGFVVTDENYDALYSYARNKDDADMAGIGVAGRVDIDLELPDGQKSEFAQKLNDYICDEVTGEYTLAGGETVKVEYESMYSNNRESSKDGFYALYGGFLFIGIILGTLFTMAAVMIIYYKQITEGYEDKSRFAIMKKVGMKDGEIRQSIRSQVLTVFFLPLLTACMHVGFAFPIIRRLLALLMLKNVGLYVASTLGTIAVFAAVYAVIYALTSRVYYRIVNQ